MTKNPLKSRKYDQILIDKEPSSVNLIMGRIAEATKESPIVVFTKDGLLWEVFGKSIYTESMIKSKAANCLGSFTKNMNQLTVKGILLDYSLGVKS